MMNTRMLAWPSYMDLFVSGPRRLSRKASERSLMPFGMALRGPLPRPSSDSYDTVLLLSRKISGGRVPALLWVGGASRFGEQASEESSSQNQLSAESQDEMTVPWFPRWNAAKLAYSQSFHFDMVSSAPYSFCA